MKIRKPDDEKFFKDIVLKDILDEISNEDGTTLKNKPQSLKKKAPKKKRSAKKIVFMSVGILLLLSIVIIFKFVADATTMVEETPQVITKNTMDINDTQEWKMEEDRVGYKKPVPPKIIEEKPVIQMDIKSTPPKTKPISVQKTERELAKEALKQQMLN